MYLIKYLLTFLKLNRGIDGYFGHLPNPDASICNSRLKQSQEQKRYRNEFCDRILEEFNTDLIR